MKLHLPRRPLALAVFLCLALTLTPFVLADPSPEPPATTEPAVVVEPAAPDNGETSPAGDVTTGPAAFGDGPVVVIDPISAELNGTVLTITWDYDWSGNNINDNDMKNALDSIPNLPTDWNDLTRINVIGYSDGIRGYNWQYLLYQYSSTVGTPPILDLSGMTRLKTIGNYYDSTVYQHQPNVQTVVFPTSLTSIEQFAFNYCSALTSVDLSGCTGLTSIEAGAFQNCKALTDVKLPAGLTSIDNAFSGCSSLTSLNIPEGVTSISGFSHCTSLTSITLPDSVTRIEDGAFLNCTKLSSVNIPDGVTYIGDGAFCNCLALASVTLPSSLTSIGHKWEHSSFWGAFTYCTNLTSLDFSKCSKLEYIGTSSFKDLFNLTSVTLPPSLTFIGSSAFANCKKLDTLNLSGCTKLATIKGGVSGYLGSLPGAFSNCPALISIDFSGCSSLATIEGGHGPDVKGAFSDCTALTSINLSGCTSLDTIEGSHDHVSDNGSHYFPNAHTEGAFSDCTALTSIDLSDCTGLIAIEGGNGNNSTGAFGGCTNLDTANLHSCTNLADISNLLSVSPASLETVDLSGCTSLNSLSSNTFQSCTNLKTINLSGTSFPSPRANSFQSSANLTSVDLSGCSHVDAIGAAFAGKTELKAVNLAGTGLTSIDAGAFQGCTNLQYSGYAPDDSSKTTLFALPPGVTSIGANAFNGCKMLGEIAIPHGVSVLNDGTFQGCEALGSIQIPDSVGPIGDSTFAGCEKLDGVVLPGNLTSIGANAFNGCKTLGKIAIPHGVSVLNDGTFQGCEALGSIQIPDSVTSIGANAFSGCEQLDGVTIPDNVGSIGANAFNGCKMLGEITLPTAVTTINDGTFADCTALANINLGQVTSIGENAFQGCEKLPDIIFNPNLSFIGPGAFTGCANLHNAYFLGGPLEHGNASQAFDTGNGVTGSAAILCYYPADQAESYQAWWGNNSNFDTRMIPYAPADLTPKAGGITWSKPGKNGNPPAYEVWDTVKFRVNGPAPSNDSESHELGSYKISTPTAWALYGPGILPSAQSSAADAVLLGLGGPTARSGEAELVTGGPFAPGGPYVGALYPSRDRPYGICTLQVDGSLLIYVGDTYGASGGYRKFPFFNGNSNTTVEFLPPPVPAEASYFLTVQNGTGSGYYEAENSAPIVARLKAEPPTPDAKFLHWELVSGTGTFADPNSPKTRFTMAVGDSTVRAVYDTGAVTATLLIKPTPTPSPPTGDSGWPIGAGLLLTAAAAALAVRARRRARG